MAAWESEAGHISGCSSVPWCRRGPDHEGLEAHTSLRASWASGTMWPCHTLRLLWAAIYLCVYNSFWEPFKWAVWLITKFWVYSKQPAWSMGPSPAPYCQKHWLCYLFTSLVFTLESSQFQDSLLVNVIVSWITLVLPTARTRMLHSYPASSDP